jgi:hypothetical protein
MQQTNLASDEFLGASLGQLSILHLKNTFQNIDSFTSYGFYVSLGCLVACRLVAGHLVACHLVAWLFGRKIIWSRGLLVTSAWSWII